MVYKHLCMRTWSTGDPPCIAYPSSLLLLVKTVKLFGTKNLIKFRDFGFHPMSVW